MEQKEKCIVILSGGVDSSTVAYWAQNEGYEVYGLSFNYGQIALKEVEYATKIAEELTIPLTVIDLSSLKNIFTGVTCLCDENMAMTSTFSDPIIVPFRNAIFLSVAVAYATAIGATHIFYGAQGSDAPHYPDCRPKFYRAFETAAKLGTDQVLSVEAPFSGLTKSKLIKLGTDLNVPYHLTWSCYLSKAKHCGTCESCTNRKNAFKEAKIRDPVEYLK